MEANIFFMITTIAIGVLILILLILLYMIYRLMHFIHKILNKAEESVEKVKETKFAEVFKNSLPIALPIIGYIIKNFYNKKNKNML